MKQNLSSIPEDTDYQPLPSELEMQGVILDMLVKDEEFTRAVDRINEDAQYVESRLGGIESEVLKEQAEEMLLDKMWKQDGSRGESGDGSAQNFSQLMDSVAGDVSKTHQIAEEMNANGIGSAIGVVGLAAGGILAGAVLLSTAGISGLGVGLVGAGGIGAASSVKEGLLGNINAQRTQINQIIEDLNDSAARLHDAREELDRMLSAHDNEEQ